MNERPPHTIPGADATLRALAELDSLEPSRSLDRAVLGQARESTAANGRVRRRGTGSALRWSLPAALAAAAICAVVVQRTASRSGPALAAGHRFFVFAQVAPTGALEMVRVSARYRGRGRRVGISAAPGYTAPSSSGESRGRLMPSFIETANDLSIRVPPPRAGATTGARATAEWMPRADARSSQRAFPPQREWTARRRTQPFELIDSVVTSAGMRLVPPPPPPSQARPGASSSRSLPVRSTSSSTGGSARQREAPPSR